MSETTCRCGRPTRDEAYVCDQCAHDLNAALGDVPWLEEELQTTITRTKGVDYRTKGTTRSSERPSPVVWSASEASTHLKAVLVSWVLFCADEGVRNQSPHQAIPEDNLTAISRWLMWRVDGLTLLDIGPEAVDEITEAVKVCHRLIDSPAAKQYLGTCDECETGRLYARPGAALARCNLCGTTIDAERLRAKLLDDLDDRLCTAAEIARLSTYLGLKADREQVRKKINQWSSRGMLHESASVTEEATFRFGAVYAMLVKDEYEPRRKKAS